MAFGSISSWSAKLFWPRGEKTNHKIGEMHMGLSMTCKTPAPPCMGHTHKEFGPKIKCFFRFF
jgi:hypothetical protein